MSRATGRDNATCQSKGLRRGALGRLVNPPLGSDLIPIKVQPGNIVHIGKALTTGLRPLVKTIRNYAKNTLR